MNRFFISKKTLCVAIAVACSLTVNASSGKNFRFRDNPTLQPPTYSIRSVEPIMNSRSLPSALSNPLEFDNSYGKEVYSEDRRRAASGGMNFLEGPDGSTWYYTASYEMEDVYYNEYYTDHIIQSFTFTIYDNKSKKIGTVKDKIRYADNEIRDKECILEPTVTLNFFNTDDKPEIMVYHAMNTDVYVNHYYYAVYSIGGEKDDEGYDKMIMTIEGRCLDAFNNSSMPGKEEYRISFVQDPYVDMDLYDPDYVAKLNEKTYHITTYTKAVNDTDGPIKFLEKDIYGTRLPGDTMDTPYFLNKSFNGERFFIFSQYEKPFFIDPRGSAEDERQTEDNSLIIEVYEVTGDSPRSVSYTQIPLNAEPSTSQNLIYTFMGIGTVAWTDDVDMKYNGTPERPAFIVARDVAKAADIDNLISSYYIYDCDGKVIETIAEDTERMYLYRNGDPEGPLAMFVKHDENEEYIFIFAFIYTGENLATIHQYNDGDPLYASCYPIKIDGVYKFAIEMRYFETDSTGNAYARVAWFGKSETMERVDRVNIGQNAQAAMVYLSSVSLNPTLFDLDDEMEYAVLVKRSYNPTVRNEYIIGDDNGKWYAIYSADDGMGDPIDLSIIQGLPNRLRITYNTNKTKTVDLPFTTDSFFPPEMENEDQNDESGIEEIEDMESPVVYYDLQGRQIKTPVAGFYIRKSDNKVTKILITE